MLLFKGVRMKNYYIFMILCFLLFQQGCASSEEFIRPGIKLRDFHRIAILPLQDYPLARGSGIIVADYISMNLLISSLSIVDRSQTTAILSEQNLGLAGIIDENTAPEAGKILGVQALLTGSISEWKCQTTNIQVVKDSSPAYITTCVTGLTLKLIDTENGQMLWAGSARGSQLNDQSESARKAVNNLMKKFLSHY